MPRARRSQADGVPGRISFIVKDGQPLAFDGASQKIPYIPAPLVGGAPLGATPALHFPRFYSTMVRISKLRERRGQRKDESKGTGGAAPPFPAGQERREPHLRLLCQHTAGGHLLPGRVPGPDAPGGVGEVPGPAEKVPVRGSGQKSHRRGVHHRAGDGQRRVPAPVGPAGVGAEKRRDPPGVLPAGHREPGHGGEQLPDPHGL